MKPLLLDFPTLFQTERLQVRKPFPGDGAEVYEAIQASLEDLVPWIPINAETEESAGGARERLQLAGSGSLQDCVSAACAGSAGSGEKAEFVF